MAEKVGDVSNEKNQKVRFKYDCKDLEFVNKAEQISGVYRLKCSTCGDFLASMDAIPSNFHCRCGKCKTMFKVEKPKRERV